MKKEIAPKKENEEENLGRYVAQFCGSTAPGQGFFYIKDTPCDSIAKDKATLAIIDVIQGEVMTKQLEGEFKPTAGESSSWRWHAKRIGEKKKFQM